jgi:hypothetical protein
MPITAKPAREWKEDDDMGKTMTTSGMTEGQINRACEIFRAQLAKHESKLSSDAVQLVFGQPELGPEWLAVLQKRVEAVSNMIVRRVCVNRNQTPQQLLDATGRVQETYKTAVATMPRGEGEEVEVFFFKASHYLSDSEVEKEFARHGLKPDPYAQSQVNIDDPVFADDHPNVTQWKDDGGHWCYLIFCRFISDRRVSIQLGNGGLGPRWWYGGVRK